MGQSRDDAFPAPPNSVLERLLLGDSRPRHPVSAAFYERVFGWNIRFRDTDVHHSTTPVEVMAHGFSTRHLIPTPHPPVHHGCRRCCGHGIKSSPPVVTSSNFGITTYETWCYLPSRWLTASLSLRRRLSAIAHRDVVTADAPSLLLQGSQMQQRARAVDNVYGD